MGRRKSALLLLTAFVALVSCKRKDATLVFGVEAQPAIVSRIGKVHYSAKVGNQILAEKEIIPKPGESPFPFEIDLESSAGPNTDISIEAYSAGPNNTIAAKPMLTRLSRAPFVKGEPKLARIRLESACMTGTPGFKAPSCKAPQTCSAGRCIDPTLLADDLDPYSKDWSKNRPDACKVANGGDPAVVIGTGQTDYVVLKEGETLTPEKGPQGGHHLWIGVHAKQLTQFGSTVTVSAIQPGTDLSVPPTSFVFPFETADPGFCKLYGLRLQLDNSAVPVQKFLGQPLDLNLTVRDADGKEAQAKVRVNVAANTIGD